ncbi:hypothetical protein GCM10022225_06400 [Plantactinospora mayteni]|uniref:Uncharacterized protein n=1 Tax=Plantactinospora mayteni TaxID=566021 RepID=A0ABQ4ER89_9ACTN|nr:hypothetical protein [Plantactinospora mayteni]GIG97130.1 hypothetical protein Pma05_37030 [Plantactinospora mayteni]
MNSRTAIERLTEYDTVLELNYAESEVGLRTMDGRTERILMKTACPTEFIVHEPTVAENGDLTMNLEIIRFELVGVSADLWPGAEVKVLGGALSAPDARPILGTVQVPAGRRLSDGVPSEQILFLTVVTPEVTLHNNTPVRMTGTLYRIPPIGSRFESQCDVPLYDQRGERHLELWACANEA